MLTISYGMQSIIGSLMITKFLVDLLLAYLTAQDGGLASISPSG